MAFVKLKNKTPKYLFVLVLGLTTFFYETVHGTDTLCIYPYNELDSYNTSDYFIKNNYFEIFEDTTNELNIDNILQDTLLKYPFQAITFRDKFVHIENINSTYWLKFYVVNLGSTKNYIFENLDQHIDHLNLYCPQSNGNYESLEAGYAKPFNIRSYFHKNFIFQFPIYDTVKPYFIKIKSSSNNPFIFKIKTNEYFTFYSNNEYYLLGLFYGIMIIMAIYNLLLFVYNNEKVYIFYVIYVLSCILISLREDGLGFQYIWPNYPEFNTTVNFLSPLLLMISFWIYSSTFLNFSINSPRLFFVLNTIAILSIIFYLINYFLLNLTLRFPIYIFQFIIIYIGGINCLIKGYRPARFFVVAYSFLMIGIIFLLLRLAFLLPHENIFTVYSFNIGLILEIVILSFSLADRLRILRIEKEKSQKIIIEQLRENERLKDTVNKELEEKVRKRTLDLNEANEELRVQNEALENNYELLADVNLKLSEAYNQLNEQAEEIKTINKLLNKDKEDLVENIKELTHARVNLKDVEYSEFSLIYKNEADCLNLLSNLKWPNNFNCRKCGYDSYCQGKDIYSRRCNRCRYHESAQSYTVFHKLRFPLEKAFYIVFVIYKNGGTANSMEISKLLSLRQATCWTFINKVVTIYQERIKKLKNQKNNDWTDLILE